MAAPLLGLAGRAMAQDSKIIGGDDAVAFAHPWTVSLGIYGSGRFFNGVDEVEPALALHISRGPLPGAHQLELRRRYFLQLVWIAVNEDIVRHRTIAAEAKSKQRSSQASVQMEVTLEEAYMGARRSLTISRGVVCKGCRKDGGPRAQRRRCQRCGGSFQTSSRHSISSLEVLPPPAAKYRGSRSTCPHTQTSDWPD